LAKTASTGTCSFCKREIPKAGMSKHLVGCERRGAGEEERLPLVVEGKWDPHYWIHLELKRTATLADLDLFLRRLWLECCGHLSSFMIGRTRYEDPPEDGFEFGEEEAGDLTIQVCAVLPPGAGGEYTYDFGSSTELKLRAMSVRRGKPSRELVRLVARNVPPQMSCKRGHGEAVGVCSICEKAVCEKCTEDHECGPEGVLPIVNSPRCGVCAYGAI
jgi:hypothetical protein